MQLQSSLEFPGLLPLIKTYLDSIGVASEPRAQIDRYLELVRRRACGELQTGAAWIRNFVRAHPSYKQDSIVPPDTVYDLSLFLKRLANKEVSVPELLGDLV